jgi:hypothetical protein
MLVSGDSPSALASSASLPAAIGGHRRVDLACIGADIAAASPISTLGWQAVSIALSFPEKRLVWVVPTFR